MAAELEKTVLDMTQLQWEASKLAQLYVLNAVQPEVPLKKMDTQFYCDLLRCCTR